MAWQITGGEEMNYHILPTNDIKEHTEETTCECEPRIEIVNGDMLIIHNAYDNREIIEKVEEILKNTGRPSPSG